MRVYDRDVSRFRLFVSVALALAVIWSLYAVLSAGRTEDAVREVEDPVASTTTVPDQSLSNESEVSGVSVDDADLTMPTVTTSTTTTTTTTTTSTTTTLPPRVTTPDGRPVLYVSPSGSDDPGGGFSIGDALQTPDFAVAEAEPGDTIHVLPGNYGPMMIVGQSDLVVSAPEGGAIFSSGRYDLLAGVLVEDSRNVVIDGLRAEFSLWGLRVDNSQGIVLRNNEVFNVGQEAIHVLNRSSDVLIEANRVDLTGQREGSRDGLPYWARGEGIYLGTGGLLDGGAVDDVSDVQVVGNHLSRISAEAVEIKASVHDVLVRDNIIHDVDLHSGAAISIGRGTRDYDANVVVEYNVIWNITSRENRTDGIGVRVSSPAIVRNNAIWDTEHYGVRIDEELRNVSGAVIIEDNVIAGSGIADVFDESGGTGVPVTVSGNINGVQADQFIGTLDASTLISRLRAM